jgi:RNA polymerase sigma-70 factor (ECF subfamily)
MLWSGLLHPRSEPAVIDNDTRCAHRELEDRLRPFVARRVPNSDVADVLQDIFLRAQRALPDLRDGQRFGPWMYQVARSAIAEHHRQRSRHPLLDAEEAEQPASDERGPSALESELAAYLVPLVNRLPDLYRAALTLTELDGLSQQAAADTLGVSLSGLKSRVQRGREKLRVMLDLCCRIALDARGRVIECEPRQAAGCRCKNE